MYVIVAGAGLIGQQVARTLVENKHNAVVIDADINVCKAIHSETGVLAIHGNATDIRVLEKAGARKADVLVCLMHNAADNTACALLAKSLGIPRIIGRLRHPRYEEAYKLAGITTVVRMSDILAEQIMSEIEQPKVRRIASLEKGKAEIHTVRIPAKVRSAGMSIQEIAALKSFPNDCVFVGIYRDSEGQYIIPRGDSVVQEGDLVFIISKDNHIHQAAEVLLSRKRFWQ